MRLTDYLELVDWTGRTLREDKRGAISGRAEKILTRLGIDDSQWVVMTSNFEQCSSTFEGNEQRLRRACDAMNYQRPSELGDCRGCLDNSSYNLQSTIYNLQSTIFTCH